MTDRWAELRGIEGQLAARIVEHNRLMLRPWRWPRCRQLRREMSELVTAMDDAFVKAGAQRPRRSQKDAFRHALGVRYDGPR